MRRVMAVLDRDKEYASRLAAYLNDQERIGFRTTALSSPEALKEYRKTARVEILLLSEDLAGKVHGLTEGAKCSVCQQILTAQTVTPALGHDFVLTDSKAATCTADGYADYDCSRCDETQTTVLPKLGHDFDASVAANVTELVCSSSRLVHSFKIKFFIVEVRIVIVRHFKVAVVIYCSNNIC